MQLSLETHRKLVCIASGTSITDDCLTLNIPGSIKPAFLRADYFAKSLKIRKDLPGIYKFADWLPIRRVLEGSSAPVTYKSNGLAKELGLENLYITFNGYWPEKGVEMTTGTFKECEAFTVGARFPVDCGKTLVVASAGNTARAFTRVCSDNNIPLVVIVPEKYLFNMWFTKPVNPCVTFIAAGENSDYFDAIDLSHKITQLDGFVPEGGAKNVARRDGMGTTVLSAVTTIGEIPDYYFQAVGSGTGAIAAWEANLKFNVCGDYNPKKMSLQVSQNAPFLPIHDAWKAGSREITLADDETCYKQIDEINAKVLSNRYPPYGILGGLFDALSDTNGDVIPITNDDAAEAGNLFYALEGNDVAPAAAVAVASLIKKVQNGDLDKKSIIMLNITGGGIERLKQSPDLFYHQPDVVLAKHEFTEDRIRAALDKTASRR